MRAAVLWLALLGAVPAAADTAAPRRIASINLCTDALLFELADASQIASVTHLSRDPALSMHAAQARHFPVNHGRAEEFIRLRPDLVLAGGGSAPLTQDLLRRLGLRVEVVPPPATLDDVVRTVRTVGELIGQPQRAEALAAALAALSTSIPNPPRHATALIVQPGGYVPGPDTLGPSLLALAGLADFAPSLALEAGGFVPLEALVLARPDFVVRGLSTGAGRALADEFHGHQALAVVRAARGGLVPVAVNDAAWACGSGALMGAVADLRAAVMPR
jgi:iron complex transport system substrate-binding protein